MTALLSTLPSRPGKADFGKYFSFTDFMWVVELQEAGSASESPEERRARLDQYQMGLRLKVHPALMAFLLELRQEGVLEPIPDGNNRSTWLLHAWNGMIAGFGNLSESEREGAYRTICRKFAHNLLFPSVDACAKSIRDKKKSRALDEARRFYAQAVDAVNGGYLSWSVAGRETCFVTGEELFCEVKAWKIRLGSVRGGEFIPMEPIDRASVIEMVVDLETGNLIVTDRIRIRQFTDLVCQVGRGGRPLSAEMGREDSTVSCARDYGFIAASLPGCSPLLLHAGGVLVVASMNEADENDAGLDDTSGAGTRVIGRIGATGRGVILIERERLVDLIAPALGVSEAEREVERYVARPDVLTLSVAKGAWFFYFSGDHDGFRRRFRTTDLDLPAGAEPFCVLSKRQLNAAGKQSRSARPGDAAI